MHGTFAAVPSETTMHDTLPATALQLRSLVKRSGELELSLVERRRADARGRRSAGAHRGLADQPVGPRPAVRRGRHGAAPRHRGTRRPARSSRRRCPRPAMKRMAGRARPVDAGRQRRRRHGGRGRRVRRRAGAARQDRGGARRRDVRAVPLRRRWRSAWCCPTARRRPKARRASSIRSPRWAWSRRCGAKATRRWCTPRRPPTSARCCNRICLKDGVAPGQHRAQARAGRAAAARMGAQHVCDASVARPSCRT